MKFEYISSGSPDCPLIRVFGTNRSEALDFRKATLDLATGATPLVVTNELFGNQSTVNCRLIMRLGDSNSGLTETEGGGVFEWVLTSDGWNKVSDLLEPFATAPRVGAYQWLEVEDAKEISILFSFSEDGHW